MNDQVSRAETLKLLSLAESCASLDGAFVEFGCYRGDTSVLLAEIAEQLYVYDSFSGLPEKTPKDISSAGENFKKGALHVSRRALVDKLKKRGLHNVTIKKAWFEDLGPTDVPERISFAFLDGDFYASQKQALALVAPQLISGAILVCHDYNNPELPGATCAVDEFLRRHPDKTLTVFETLAIIK